MQTLLHSYYIPATTHSTAVIAIVIINNKINSFIVVVFCIQHLEKKDSSGKNPLLS